MANPYERKMMQQPVSDIRVDTYPTEYPLQMANGEIVLASLPDQHERCVDCPYRTSEYRSAVCPKADTCFFAWLAEQADQAGNPETLYVDQPLTPLGM
jgi:hypothetical protein